MKIQPWVSGADSSVDSFAGGRPPGKAAAGRRKGADLGVDLAAALEFAFGAALGAAEPGTASKLEGADSASAFFVFALLFPAAAAAFAFALTALGFAFPTDFALSLEAGLAVAASAFGAESKSASGSAGSAEQSSWSSWPSAWPAAVKVVPSNMDAGLFKAGFRFAGASTGTSAFARGACGQDGQ